MYFSVFTKGVRLMLPFVQHICDCAVYYVGQVYTRVTDEDIYKDGQFHASEKVPILHLSHVHTESTCCVVCDCVLFDDQAYWKQVVVEFSVV